MTNDNLSNIVLFGGNLDELNNFTNKRYTIAKEFFESKPYADFSDLEEGCRKELKNKGYDGIIYRQNNNPNFAFLGPFLSFTSISGVPVKLIEKGK